MTQRLAAALGVVVAVLAGLWLLASVVAPGYRSAIALATAWLVIVGVVVWRLTRAAPRLRLARLAYLACVALAVAGFYATFVRDTVVDEALPGGVPQSRATAAATTAPSESGAATAATNVIELIGPIRAKAPAGAGIARVVRLIGGERRLTFADGFEVSGAPRLRLRLATDAGGAKFRQLGALKGNKGDQQYALPASLSLSLYDTVVIWSAALSQVLATAELAPA